MTPETIAPAAEGPADAGSSFDTWVRQARQRTPAAPKPPRRKKGWGVTALLVGLSAAAVALVVCLAHRDENEPGPGRAVVLGVVQDGTQQPLDGALVFAVGYPDVMVKTDATGAFRLPRVPPGPHVLLVVVNDIGQEYPVSVADQALNDAGVLPYLAPPDR